MNYVILEKAVSGGLVKKKVQVKTPAGIIQAFRWVDPNKVRPKKKADKVENKPQGEDRVSKLEGKYKEAKESGATPKILADIQSVIDQWKGEQKGEQKGGQQGEPKVTSKVGQIINVEGKKGTITAVGKDGVTARDEKGKAHQILHDHVKKFQAGKKPMEKK
jgi:hypothetical protein